MQLIEGLRILDLSMHLAGPYCTMLLADMGADVLKLEPPDGDPLRRVPPIKDGVSLLFASVNRNKRSIAVNLHEKAGRDLALRFIGRADVLFDNFRPGVMERLGLSFEEAVKVNPLIVHCSLTGYGQTGPRRAQAAFDLAIQAMSGGMSLTGHPGAPPTRAGIPIADLAGGMFAAIAILGGLRRRDATREPVRLDISLLDGQISMLTYWAAIALNTGQVPGPQGSGNAQMVPSGAFPTADGYVAIAPYAESFWPKFCAAIDRLDLVHHPRFATLVDRIANRAELEQQIETEFRKRTTAEWLERLPRFDIPCSSINDVRAACEEPQVLARKMRVKVPWDDAALELVGNPVKTWPDSQGPYLPPPRLNEHMSWALETWLGEKPQQSSWP